MAFLSRLSPWSMLSDLQREMDQLTRNLFGQSYEQGSSGTALMTKAWTPAVDVLTRGSDLVVRADLPGVDPEKDVDISVSDGVLHIRGERRSEQRDEGDNYVRLESSYGAFERNIPLPEGVDVDGIKAVHKQGILEVTVPGAARIAPARKIPVELEAGSRERIGQGTQASQAASAGPDRGAGAAGD